MASARIPPSTALDLPSLRGLTRTRWLRLGARPSLEPGRQGACATHTAENAQNDSRITQRATTPAPRAPPAHAEGDRHRPCILTRRALRTAPWTRAQRCRTRPAPSRNRPTPPTSGGRRRGDDPGLRHEATRPRQHRPNDDCPRTLAWGHIATQSEGGLLQGGLLYSPPPSRGPARSCPTAERDAGAAPRLHVIAAQRRLPTPHARLIHAGTTHSSPSNSLTWDAYRGRRPPTCAAPHDRAG